MKAIPRLFALLVAMAFFVAPVSAHEVRPAYLGLRQTGEQTYEVVWQVPAAAGGMRLGLYVRLPDTAEVTTQAIGRFAGTSYVERFELRHPGGLSGQTIHIDGLRSTLTDVLVRVERLDGTTQVARVSPEAPSFVVTNSPDPWQVAGIYSGLGLEHTLLGIDHLLFVLGLLLIVRGRGMLVRAVTAFTLAHSLTLAVATFGVAAVPVEPLNAAIALSILFLGPEIVRARRGETSLTIRHPAIVAFLFGLLHGFGFASGLSSLGLSQGDVVQALLWFNVGVELGQLGFVVLVLMLLRSFRVLELTWPKVLTRMPEFAVGVCGAYWTVERTTLLFSR